MGFLAAAGSGMGGGKTVSCAGGVATSVIAGGRGGGRSGAGDAASTDAGSSSIEMGFGPGSGSTMGGAATICGITGAASAELAAAMGWAGASRICFSSSEMRRFRLSCCSVIRARAVRRWDSKPEVLSRAFFDKIAALIGRTKTSATKARKKSRPRTSMRSAGWLCPVLKLSLGREPDEWKLIKFDRVLMD